MFCIFQSHFHLPIICGHFGYSWHSEISGGHFGRVRRGVVIWLSVLKQQENVASSIKNKRLDPQYLTKCPPLVEMFLFLLIPLISFAASFLLKSIEQFCYNGLYTIYII